MNQLPSKEQAFFDIPKSEMEFVSNELQSDNYSFEGKTILLLGAFGFLGKLYMAYFNHLNENILRDPCRVIAMDNFVVGKGSTALNVKNFEFERFDICQPLPPRRVDYVINCCGIASPVYYKKFPLETIEVSYTGTKNVLEYCRAQDVGSTLFFSSSEVYGNPPTDKIPTNEKYIGNIETMGERSCYDVGKLAIETLCHIYHTKYGLNTKIIRPFNVFGYIQQTDGRVIPNFVSNIVQNKKIKIYGNGKQTRTFCWFTDFIVGTIKVLLHGDNEPYNIGNQDNEIEMIELARLVEKVCGKTDMIELIPSPAVYANEPRRRCPDITKARNLGYNPKVSLEEGARKFYEWAKNNYK